MIKTDSIMKRLLVLLIPLLVGLVSCSDQLNTNEGDGETGEMVEPVYSQDTFENESAIILMDVPGIKFLVKSVLTEKGIEAVGDSAIIVNKRELLKEGEGYYGEIYQWPEIDFDSYSLVLGQFMTGDQAGYTIAQNYIVRKRSRYELYIEIKSTSERHLAVSTVNYFVVLYPKLPDGELEVKRLSTTGLAKE